MSGWTGTCLQALSLWGNTLSNWRSRLFNWMLLLISSLDSNPCDLDAIFGLLTFSQLVRINDLWDSLVIHDGFAHPLQRFSGLDHMNEELSLKDPVVLWDVFFESEVATTNSNHELISIKLHDRLLSTNEVNHALNMDNWNGEMIQINKSFQLLL
jgi:hypothetical protein